MAVLSLTGTSLTTLNRTIDDNNIDPALTLNTSLYAADVMAVTDDGIVMAAEVPSVSPDLGQAGLCVWVADENKWECIGTVEMTFSYNQWRYVLSRNDINSTYSALLGYSPGTGNYTYYYSTSSPTSTNISFTRINNSETRFNTSTIPYIYLRPNGTATNFYRVTYDYLNQTDTAVYVQAGQTTTSPSLADDYVWQNQTDSSTVAGGQTVTVNASVTYKQISGKITVNWIHPDSSSTEEAKNPSGGSATFDVPALLSDYIWVDGSGNAVTGTTVTISQDTTYRAVPKYYTITYLSSTGATLYTDIAEYGTTYTLRNTPTGHIWADGSNTIYAGQIDAVKSDLTLIARVIATFNYSNGTTTVDGPHPTGTTITLPALSAGSIWTDEDGTNYNAGDSFILNESMAFVESSSLSLSYDVNFPMNGYSYGSLTVTKPSVSPTVEGMVGSTGSVTILPGGDTIMRTVSQTMVNLETSHSKDFDYPVLFRGWMSETDELISPYSRLSWQELQSYDENGDGTVTMTGVWEHGLKTTANFFILYNSAVDQTSGNAADYTDVIFTTFAGNGDPAQSPLFTANNDTKALENDAKIRAMYGERADGMWFQTFPTDEEIFAALNTYAKNGTLTVGGETVRAEDLNSNEYAIRWYHAAYESSDGWHIDGKLTRKVGMIHVTKTFSGNETLIDAAKEDFYITANNADSSKYYVLTLKNLTTAQQQDHPAYKTGAQFLTPIDDGDDNPNTYLWEVTGVRYNEAWHIEETPPTVVDAADYSEWAIVDSSIDSQTGNGTGTNVQVDGVTHASDLADPEWLRAEFNNIYYRGNSLMIKKEDAATGEALAGAQFQLYQNDKLMAFTYNSATGLYDYDSSGTNPSSITTLTGNGYINISTTGFSYDVGPITVVEIKAPTNYNPVGSIEVGYTDSVNKVIGILNDTGSFASYHDGLLVVENSTNTLNVTARKSWECEESEWRDITVQLFANGSANLAATLTGQASTVVPLTAANDYSHTWTDLPIYAYGAKVEWSIKETKIGDESCKADYTFANWAVSYDAPTYDSDGNVTLVVHNTPSRPLLFLTKTNADGSYQLSGATFTLVQVNASGNTVSGFVPRTGTTNENGVLIFDNLLYGARYRIVEESPPPGYQPMTTPIYLTIAEGGVVTVESHTHARADAVAYNIVVTNDAYPPLPATGGPGTQIYTQTGALLMAAALLLLVYEKQRRREGNPDA